MPRILIFLLPFILFLHLVAGAQSQQAYYTGGNALYISVESNDGLYEYTTNNMLIRYNQKTKKVECVFNINSLLPANDSSPVAIVQDMFFAAKYPVQIIEIAGPDAQTHVGTPGPLQTNRSARVLFQAVPVEMSIPITFLPDRNSLLFSTTFDIFLPDYRIAMPARYIPRLTGRIIYSIRNARWVERQ